MARIMMILDNLFYLSQQAWWQTLKDVFTLLAGLVALVTLVLNTKARRLNNTMSVVDFYNQDVRQCLIRTFKGYKNFYINNQ